MNNLIRYGGTYLINNLLEGRMSAASICKFNDPFELHHRPGRFPTEEEENVRVKAVARRNKEIFEAKVLLSGGNLSRAKRKVNKAIKKKTGNQFKGFTEEQIDSQRERSFRIFDEAAKVICCTLDQPPHPGEIPMWGYYAQDHNGIRIHYRPEFYQRPGILVIPMEYEVNPVEFGFPETTPKGMRGFVDKIVKTKSTGWRHEAEIRLIVPVALLSQASDGIGIQRWWLPTEERHVARVDLGIKFDNSDLLSELRSKLPSVEIFKTQKDPNAFLCQYERI